MFIFLFILSLVLTAGSWGMIGVILVGVNYVNSDRMILGLVLWVVAFLVFAALGCVAHFLQNELREDSESKAMRIVLKILSFLTIIQYGIGYFVLSFFVEMKKHDVPTRETVEAKDENGDKHSLTQTYTGSNTYKDEHGDYWTSSDGGETFHRD